MMRVFSGETADEAWREAVDAFAVGEGIRLQKSQHGETQELLHAGFSIRDPRQRWVINRQPALNPAFALAEVIWILNGRNESAFLNYWNTQLPKFAGYGETYHGAYGFRIRRHFEIDQLERAYRALENNQNSRQVVLLIWDPWADLPHEDGSPTDKDVPCNVMSLMKVRDNELHWTQIMRSNDLFLGTPHNFIQFTTLQEVMAGWLGVGLGPYNHLSDSLHVYKDRLEEATNAGEEPVESNTDDLSVSKEEADQIFPAVYRDIATMIEDHLTEKQLAALSIEADKPEAFRNILLVMAAEAARRRAWVDFAHEAMEQCTNPIMYQAWQRWFSRVST